MPRYRYVALSPSGMAMRGEGVAATAEDLKRQLSDQGLLVQRVQSRLALPLFKRQTAKPEEVVLFNHEFLALVRAGLTIPDALQLVAHRPDSPRLGEVLRKVYDAVRGGTLLSEACAQHPDVFEPLYLTSLRTGEKTGDLVSVLARYHEYLKQRVALRKKVSRALAYPVFLLVALVAILGVLFTFVLPRFVAMYADFGAALPFPTQVLLGIVENMPIVLLTSGAVGVAGWLAWRRWGATEAGRFFIDRIKERTPLLGNAQRELAVAQLARSLSALLAGGTPLVEALQTVQSAISNRAYARRVRQVTEAVSHGEHFARALRSHGVMPDTATKMVEVGEASGNLDGMLSEVAAFYEEMLDNRLARLMTLIEPALMLLMGLLIGGIIIVMYLPIFNMADIIQ